MLKNVKNKKQAKNFEKFIVQQELNNYDYEIFLENGGQGNASLNQFCRNLGSVGDPTGSLNGRLLDEDLSAVPTLPSPFNGSEAP